MLAPFLFSGAEEVKVYRAGKAGRMPLLAAGVQTHARDGHVTLGTFGNKETLMVLFAIWLVLVYHKSAIGKGLMADGADKVFWMPRLVQGRQALLSSRGLSPYTLVLSCINCVHL